MTNLIKAEVIINLGNFGMEMRSDELGKYLRYWLMVNDLNLNQECLAKWQLLYN